MIKKIEVKTKKMFLIFTSIVILPLQLWTQDFPEREAVTARIFAVGNGNGELGLLNMGISSGGPVQPSAFCFDKDHNLYVCDTVNKRICIFDSNFQYIRSINNSPIITASALEVDEQGYMVGYHGGNGIEKMDNSGKEIFEIFLYGADRLIDEIDNNKGFFIDDDLVIAYKEDGGLIGYKNPGTDYRENNQNVMDTDEVVKEIQRNHPALRVEKEKAPMTREGSSRTNVPQRSSDSVRFLLYQNGQLLGRDFSTFEEVAGTNVATKRNSDYEDNPYYSYFRKYPRAVKRLYGTDNDGNSLWSVGIVFMVFDPVGEPITAFMIGRNQRSTSPVVAPTGDVYYMNVEETGHFLYKIERDW